MLKKIITASALALLVAFLATGCATVTRGTKDTLVVESDPAGARVTLSNGLSGTTPASFKFPRKENLLVTIEKDGYEKVQVNVTSNVATAGGAAMAGNVLMGGLVGAAVDAGTGAMYDLKPNPVSVHLSRLESNRPAAAAPASGASERTKTAEERLSELKVLLDRGVISQAEYDERRQRILSQL